VAAAAAEAEAAVAAVSPVQATKTKLVVAQAEGWWARGDSSADKVTMSRAEFDELAAEHDLQHIVVEQLRADLETQVTQGFEEVLCGTGRGSAKRRFRRAYFIPRPPRLSQVHASGRDTRALATKLSLYARSGTAGVEAGPCAHQGGGDEAVAGEAGIAHEQSPFGAKPGFLLLSFPLRSLHKPSHLSTPLGPTPRSAHSPPRRGLSRLGSARWYPFPTCGS
jgi:hypothetical protein